MSTEEESWIVFSEFGGDLKKKQKLTNHSLKINVTWIEKGGNKQIHDKREDSILWVITGKAIIERTNVEIKTSAYISMPM